MTNLGYHGTNEGWFMNILHWKKKKNHCQNKGPSSCRTLDQMTQKVETVKRGFYSNRKGEGKMPMFNVNKYGNQKEKRKFESCPGKNFQMERRGCGFHVYFCIDNLPRSDHARYNQVKTTKKENNKVLDCFEGTQEDKNKTTKNTCIETYLDDMSDKFSKTVRFHQSHIPKQSSEAIRQRKLTRYHWDVNNPVAYNLENLQVKNVNSKLHTYQSESINKNFKDSLGSSISQNQIKNLEEKEKRKHGVNNMKSKERFRSKDGCIHHGKENLANDVCGWSVTENQAECINSLTKSTEGSKETERRAVDPQGIQIEESRNLVKCCSNARKNCNADETNEKHLNSTNSTWQMTENATNVFTESNVHGILADRIHDESPHKKQTIHFIPPVDFKETEQWTMNRKSSEEDAIFYQIQNVPPIKRTSTMKSRNTFYRSLSDESNEFLESLVPEIMLKLNNIEEKIIIELEKNNDKGKRVPKIKNIMDISCNDVELKNDNKSKKQITQTSCSKNNVSKTIQIQTCDEDIVFDTPESLSITKKMRNGGETEQIVYHNTYELDSYNTNTTSKPLGKNRTSEYVTPKDR